MTTLYLEIDARTTTEARRLMARGLGDGTSLQATDFSVGRGGFEPFDYLSAIPVNPDASDLDDSVLTKAITHFEFPNSEAACYYCLLESADANVTLGEIGIWGTVQNSPGDPVSGSAILMAIGHFPLIAKNSDMQYVLRVTMVA